VETLSELPAWALVTALAAAAQACAAICLVLITGYYAYWVRRQVQLQQTNFEQQLAQQRREFQTHLEEARRQEDLRARRALNTLLTELRLNAEQRAERYEETSPLLYDAYASNIWAVSELGLPATTWKSLGRAYTALRKQNALYLQAVSTRAVDPHVNGLALTAFRDAQTAIGEAIAQLEGWNEAS